MATIQGIYIALFGRPADPAGLAFFNAATSGGTDLTAIGDLAASAEYQSRFDGMSNEEIITEIFQSLFGRAPDADGLAFFVEQLESGAQNINTIAINILDGAQGDDATVVANKLVAANRWTLSLDTEAEVDAYVGDDAADAGRAFLAGITADPLTIPTLAETESAIGAIVGEGGVVAALEVLAAAQDGVDSALEALARADNAEETDNDALEGTDLESFIENYDDATDAQNTLDEAEQIVSDAQVDLATAQADLANDRIADGSDAEVNTDVAVALAAVKADATANGLLNARTAAEAAVAADVGANGTNVQLLTEIRDAIAAYAAAGGDLTVEVEAAGPVTVAEFLADINAQLAAPINVDAVDAYVSTLEDYDFDEVAGAIAGSTADDDLNDLIDDIAGRADLLDDVAAAQTALNGDPLGQDLIDAETVLDDRQDLISDVADAQADVTEAQAYLAQIEELFEAYEAATDEVTEASDVFEDLGFEAPVVLTAGSVVATADSDIYLADDDGLVTISNFGAAGTDILFVGSEFVTVDIDGDLDLSGIGAGSDTAGSASALEIFIQQDGGNTVLYIENTAFEGNNTTAAFDGQTITLVGVNASDLSFDNGYFSVNAVA